LSFATVLGLVLFCERIHFFLYEKIVSVHPILGNRGKL